MAKLRGRTSRGAIALEFAILAVARTSSVVGAVGGEFDLDAKTWTIPASRMKAGREHRVPLVARAVAILRPRLDHCGEHERVFPLSNKALIDALKEMQPGLTVHGFRSSFRDWAGDRTRFDRETINFCLAHGINNKTEAAYRRGDALEKRRLVLAAWAKYCASPPVAVGGNVAPFRARARA